MAQTDERRPGGTERRSQKAAGQVASTCKPSARHGHSAPATLALLSRQLRDEGMARANTSMDAWTRSCWQAGINYWASTGLPFGADEVRELGVPEPESSGVVGALFLANCRAGVIKPHGFMQSRRSSRHASWQRQWIGGDVG